MIEVPFPPELSDEEVHALINTPIVVYQPDGTPHHISILGDNPYELVKATEQYLCALHGNRDEANAIRDGRIRRGVDIYLCAGETAPIE